MGSDVARKRTALNACERITVNSVPVRLAINLSSTGGGTKPGTSFQTVQISKVPRLGSSGKFSPVVESVSICILTAQTDNKIDGEVVESGSYAEVIFVSLHPNFDGGVVCGGIHDGDTVGPTIWIVVGKALDRVVPGGPIIDPKEQAFMSSGILAPEVTTRSATVEGEPSLIETCGSRYGTLDVSELRLRIPCHANRNQRS